METKEKSGEAEERIKNDAEKFLITRPTCILHLFISLLICISRWNVKGVGGREKELVDEQTYKRWDERIDS